MIDPHSRRPRDRGPHRQHIVIARRSAIFDLDLSKNQQIALVFQVTVRQAQVAQQLGPRLLEVDQVIGVVQQPHPVGFRVAHTDGDFTAEHGCPGQWVFSDASQKRDGSNAPAKRR
jgi:hypothetical protein